MTKWLLSAALMLSAFASTTVAQSKESLVGTWKLVSVTVKNNKGELVNGYGPNPIGLLTYTTDGRMSVVMADSRRKPFSTDSPTATERAEAFDTLFAYAGSYTVAGGKVMHHIEIASAQELVNTDQERSINLQADRLTLKGGWLVDGVMYQPNNEVVWERLKPSKP